ncbi:katanin p60 ATPase-containing subunit A-like 2 isoform X9 [Stigmatopora argus]
MDHSYNSIKLAHQAREADELRIEMRKRSLLILIYQHLMRQGFTATAVALDQEMNGSVKKFEVCENIDLEMVLLEYESYHYVKFQKYPKLIKKVAEPVSCQGESRPLKSGGKKRAACSAVKPLPKVQPPNLGGDSKVNASAASAAPMRANGESLSCPPDFSLSVYPIISAQAGGAPGTKKVQVTDIAGGEGDGEEERLLKPLSGFSGMSGEMKELAAVINKDIYLHNPNVRWEDIIGLEDAKRLVKESIIYPIKVLFELARYHAPSTIFLDEVDSMMGQRGSNVLGEHESSRRLKAELLVQMDGLAGSEDLVFVLAASNLPWELDQGMLRRLEKRILVSLPPPSAREAMITHWLPPVNSTGEFQLKAELDYQLLAKEMKGYSGSDIRLVCKEAAMRQVRKVFEALESNQNGDAGTLTVQLETVTTQDFLEVLAHTKPSVRDVMEKHTAWEKDFKSV